MQKENLSTRIVLLRKEFGLNQSQLGNELSLSQDAISDIERGRRTTTIEKLIEIADFFNVSLDYITGRSDTRERQP